MARNILVVEDDNNISNLIKMYLDKEGFDVRIAADGGKAVEEFKAREPDLVLLDVMLPVLDGWGVCAKIRETSKCPIIMLTAKGEVNDRIHGLEMGADDYVVKPFEMKELLARINALGVGPQGFGGKTTALAVNIETAPTHIAGLPVAVNINCHVTRHKSEVL